MSTPFSSAETLVGNGGIVLDFMVGLTLGAGEDFVGWFEGGEEAESARVWFLLLLFGWCGFGLLLKLGEIGIVIVGCIIIGSVFWDWLGG